MSRDFMMTFLFKMESEEQRKHLLNILSNKGYNATLSRGKLNSRPVRQYPILVVSYDPFNFSDCRICFYSEGCITDATVTATTMEAFATVVPDISENIEYKIGVGSRFSFKGGIYTIWHVDKSLVGLSRLVGATHVNCIDRLTKREFLRLLLVDVCDEGEDEIIHSWKYIKDDGSGESVPVSKLWGSDLEGPDFIRCFNH